MKKLLALMLVFLLIFMVGCVTDDDDDDDDRSGNDTEQVNTDGNGDNTNNDGTDNTDGGTVASGTYFPLTVGSSWNYRETGVDWDGESYTEEYTTTVTGTTTINGISYAVVTEDGDSTYMRVDNNAIYTLDYFNYDDVVAKSAALPEAAKAAARQALAAEGEIMLVDFNKSIGQSWTIYEDSQSGEGYSYTSSYTGKIVGTENVTVAAGSFSGCVKVELTMAGSSSSSYNNETYSTEWRDTSFVWFGNGVGVVKESDSSTETTQGVTDVLSSSSMELTSYSIAR